MSKVKAKKKGEDSPDDEEALSIHPDYPEYGELKTEVGLKFINWGLIIYMVSLLVTLTVGISGLSSPSMATLIAFSCGLVFLSFITFIMFVMGFYNVNLGRSELDEKHESYARLGLILFIIYVLVVAVTIVVPVAYALSDPDVASEFTKMTQGDDEDDEDDTDANGNDTVDKENRDKALVMLKKIMIITSILGVISTSLLSFALTIVHLRPSKPKMRTYLLLSLKIIIISSVVGFFIVYYITAGITTDLSDEELQAFSNISNLTTGITLFGFFLLTYLCYKAYNRIKTREYFKDKDYGD